MQQVSQQIKKKLKITIQKQEQIVLFVVVVILGVVCTVSARVVLYQICSLKSFCFQ